MSPERGRGLCQLVQPHHPAVQALLSRWVPDPGDRLQVLAGVCSMVAEFSYTGAPGSTNTLADVVRQQSGNCLDLSALAVSGYRAAGISAAHVLIGAAKGMFPVSVHAWAVVTVGHDRLALDPGAERPHLSDADALLAGVKPIAFFNDVECVRGAADIRALLSGTHRTELSRSGKAR